MRYLDAVRTQGQNLRGSRAAVTARLATTDLTAWRQRRLVLTGMGASSNAIAAALPGFWAAGVRAAGWSASDLLLAGSAADAEAVIAVSQTGKSAELYQALRALPAGCARLVVTDVPDSPIGDLADAVLALALSEDSEVRTVGYTGTVQALLLLAEALTGPLAGSNGRRYVDGEWLAAETDRLIPAAEALAARLLPTLRATGATSATGAIDVVGSGVHAGTAMQGALLLREVSKLPATGYDTYQYLHGPIEAARAGSALIVIGGDREVRLAASMATAGVNVVLITDQDADPAGVTIPAGVTVFRIPQAGEAAGIFAVLPLQAIAGALAADAQVPDGVFRYHQDDTKVS